VDVAQVVCEALTRHAAIQAVRLAGSRAEGQAHDLSDWDFAVETTDFGSVARDMHLLVAPLHPLAEQWDPYSTHPCYMLMLPGPTKIDFLFPDERRSWSPPWEPSPETLGAIDLHFWDWILWLEQKRRGGNEDALAKSMVDMHELMLRPMGVAARPHSVSEATAAYLKARSELEKTFGTTVPRTLEREVLPALLRAESAGSVSGD
jgi:hypothetical protein